MPSSAAPVVRLDSVEIALEPWSWPFAVDRRQEIDQHFARLQQERSGVWNGRVLLLHGDVIDGAVLRGACFETDYASLCAWRDWDFPDRGVGNFFAAAALQAADGAYLLGEMAADTANSGLVYFPCGTPEPDDLDSSGAIDLSANLARELVEETGIEIGELACDPGWTLVRDRCFVGLLKRTVARQGAEELRGRILRHIAGEARPELSDIRIVRGRFDLDARMPGFVVAFLEAMWRQ